MTTIHRVGLADLNTAKEEIYQSLVEKAPLGVYRRKTDGTLVMANLMLAKMLGYESSKGLRLLNFSRDICVKTTENVDYATGDGEAYCRQAEVQVRRRDGSRMTARITESPASTPGIIDGFVENISAQRDAERKLELAQKMEAIGQLAGGVAHDFNNIINLIGVYAELLAAKPLPADNVRSHAEAILQGTRRGAWLTQQLLALGHSRPPRPQITDVRDLLRPFKKTLPQLLGKPVKCRIIDSREPVAVRIDRSQWEQVILNLAINARDSMPAGGRITIATRLIPEATAKSPEANGGYLELTVSDSGGGMDESTLLRVFEPYFTTKVRGKGTGLGLTLVYKVVSESGGSVNVSSVLGKGTKVRILMPVANLGAQSRSDGSVELGRANSSQTRSLRIRARRNNGASPAGYRTSHTEAESGVARGLQATSDQ